MVTALIIISALLVALSVALIYALLTAQRSAHEGAMRYESEAKTLRDSLAEAERSAAADQIQIATLEATIKAREEQATHDAVREKQMNDQFKLLATEVLKEQTKQFKEGNRESIDTILKPLQERLKTFGERVESIHTEENKQRSSLQTELKHLMELNNRITLETKSLTSALKGNSKVQGDWGEMILETILESSSLKRGIHYTTQHNFKDEEGNNLRPDVVLNLPDGKRVIIDSKTSITAFSNYANEEDAELRKRHLAAHILSVRQHIKELADKNYQQMQGSPDFVIMFIPSEPAFLAALQPESNLWSEAYDRRVIISSPTNLFALLKLVSDLWKRDAQDRNTLRIAEQGTALYEQLVKFTEVFGDVGRALDTARTKYDEAYKRFTTGNNNAIRCGERLRKLGLSTKKSHSDKVLSQSDIDDDVDMVEE